MAYRKSWEYPPCPCCGTDVLVDTLGGINEHTFGNNYKQPDELESWFVCYQCDTRMLEVEPMKKRMDTYKKNRRENANLDWLSTR